MQKHNYILLVALTMCFVTLSFSQHTRYSIQNGIGLQGGITQFDILTDNFKTQKGNGWIAGLNATVDLPHKWYTVSYGMLLSESNIEVYGLESMVSSVFKPIDYKLMAVQVGFTFHINLIDQNLILEVGPQLQYNSELQLKDESLQNYFIDGLDSITAHDIQAINKFNANGMLGASVGVGTFRLRAQYIYGLTNMLNKLNEKDFNSSFNEKFKGNQSMLVLTAMFTF